MLYQVTHGKPLASGHLSRRPQAAYDFLESTPFLNRLRTENVMDPELVDVSRQLRTLADAGIPYLIIHKRAPLKEGHIDSWRQWLGVDPAYEDGELAVFRTDLRSGRDFEIRQLLTEGIGIINR